MPIYEYRCRECDACFEALQRIGADGSKLNCPQCGAKSPDKLFSMFASAGDASSRSDSKGCAPSSGFT